MLLKLRGSQHKRGNDRTSGATLVLTGLAEECCYGTVPRRNKLRGNDLTSSGATLLVLVLVVLAVVAVVVVVLLDRSPR